MKNIKQYFIHISLQEIKNILIHNDEYPVLQNLHNCRLISAHPQVSKKNQILKNYNKDNMP
jgi:hypothetical protein